MEQLLCFCLFLLNIYIYIIPFPSPPFSRDWQDSSGLVLLHGLQEMDPYYSLLPWRLVLIFTFFWQNKWSGVITNVAVKAVLKNYFVESPQSSVPSWSEGSSVLFICLLALDLSYTFQGWMHHTLLSLPYTTNIALTCGYHMHSFESILE